MISNIDLRELLARENEQTEWKENVADVFDVVKTLAAFANDLANLGGGYVICGAREDKDENGFQTVVKVGLTATQLKKLENEVLAKCRERISPPITPQLQELPSDSGDSRILVFLQPATGHAHTARANDDGARHYVRVGRSTIEARNGVLRDLLVLRGDMEPWDRRICPHATVADLDLLVLRDTLQRIGIYNAEDGVEPYLSPDRPISTFVPALCAREPLTGAIRPRNFSILLFGRETQRLIPCAFSMFSIYSGVDRSTSYAVRHEIAGNLIEQAKKLSDLLGAQSFTVFDKTDTTAPNAVTYPSRVLYEAMGNALSHRDYQVDDPTRITAFSDRIEVLSPGGLPRGVDPSAFRTGRAAAVWRNQALAWFFSKLHIAQAEGQGIPTILRILRDEGFTEPVLDPSEHRVSVTLPAHPKHIARTKKINELLASYGLEG